MECLICTQDWLRVTPHPFEIEENMAKMEELELGKKNLLLFVMQYFKCSVFILLYLNSFFPFFAALK